LLIALRTGASRFRSGFAVAATALLVAAVLALPGGALASSTRLFDPAVAPRAGTTATTFALAVTYRNREGSGPNEVVVLIDGVRHAMVAGPGNDWKNGVRFTFATRLATGTHSIAFHSLGRDRFVDDVDAGSVRVGAAPAPRPTPAPTPRPDREPVAGPPSTPTPDTAPTSMPSSADRWFDRSPGGISGGGGRDAGGTPPSDGTAPSDGLRSSAAGTGGADAHGDGHGGASDPATASDGSGSSNPAGAGWGDLTVYLKALSWGGSATRSMPLLPSIVFTAGTMAILTAFLFFGKRRRDGEPPEPDEVLSAAAARGTGQPATATLVPDRPPVQAGVPEDEIGMPRWRRPSLLEARKTDPTRSAAAVVAPLTFARGAVGPVEGHERRLIRYHVVRLLDAPDELRGEEIGIVARDDEVQLLERSGTYWRVLCPDGRQGWIHKMTLGDVVAEAGSARDAWGNPVPDVDDVDDDVLTAFMTARSRA
jgi:hypothetical protein